MPYVGGYMLKIYFEGEFLEFNDDDLDYMFVNDGQEAKVYRHGKDALKIYKKECYRARLNEGVCENLSSIDTKRILLPEKLIYDGDCKTFIGYSLPFVYTVSCSRILDMNIGAFVDEVDILKADLEVLSDNKVEVNDWHNGNVLYDGKRIFMGDPGSYVVRSDDYRWCLENNIEILNEFLKSDIFQLAGLSKTREKNMNIVFDDYEYLGNQIRESMNERETVRQYVKRITK